MVLVLSSCSRRCEQRVSSSGGSPLSERIDVYTAIVAPELHFLLSTSGRERTSTARRLIYS